MAQRVSNIYRLITIPQLYAALQSVLGAHRSRRRFVDEVLQPVAGMRFLDVGCGPASILQYLPKVNYTGLDLNPEHIEYARARYADRGTFLVADVAKMKLEAAGSFDLILLSGLLHHLDDGPAMKLLADLIGLLKPDGRIVSIDGVWLSPQNPIARLFNRLDSGKNIRTPDGYVKLTKHVPVRTECRTYRDSLRVPYDHFCMTLTLAPEA